MTGASKAATLGMKALTIASNMFTMWAITTTISLVIKGIDNLVHASEKAIERMDEAKTKISELNTAHESHAKLVKESGDRYIELSNKMNSLTTDELEEFNELNKQFTEAFPELITGFDNQGNAIANIGTNAEESKKKLQELLEQEEKTANYEIFKNLNDLYAGTKVKLDEAIKSQKEYGDSISKANEKLKNTEGFTEFDDSISITLDYKNNGAQIRNNLMNLLDEFKRTLHEDYDDYSLDQELINTATAIDNGTFDEYTGEQNVWFSLVNWTPEQKSLFKQMLQDDSIEVTSAIKNELANVSGALKDEIGNLTQENEKAQQEAESAWRDYTNNLANAMQSQQTFKDIGDEGLQDIAIAMVRGLDKSLYEEGQNINYDWIRNNILNGLKNLDDDAKFEVKMAYQQLLTLDPNDITPENQLAIENIINELARLLDKDPIQIRLAFGFDENGLQTQYAQTMRKAYAKFGGDQYDDKGFVTGDTELDKFAKDNSIKTKEEVEFWNKCIEESATREEAMQKYLNQNPDKTDNSWLGFTEEQTKLVDDFESKLKTLSATLSSLKDGSYQESGFADLVKDFPELQGQSENLEQAITDLIYNSLQQLYTTLGTDLPDDVKNSLQAMVDSASGASIAVKNAFSSIQKSYEVLNDFKDAMNDNALTDSIMNAVAGLSDNLNTLVAGFYAGTVSADELYSALQSYYNTDLENYGKALIAKNQYSEEFYNAVGLADTEFINTFYDHYKIDLKNCKKYAEAKKQIELSTLNLVEGRWQRYYNIQTDTLTTEYDKLMEGARNGDAYANQIAYQVLSQINKYRNAIAELNNVPFNGIEASFDGISSSLDNNGNSGTNKQSTETIDYIQIALSRIQREIQNIDKVASDASASSKKRMQAYNDEIEAINKELELQGQAYDYYLNKANSVDLSEDIKAKIRNGSISIEDYDSEIAKKIKEYQEFWEQALDRMDAADELQRRINELLIAKIDLQINKLSSEYEKFNRRLDMLKGIISLKEKFGFNVTEGDYNKQNNSLISQIANLNKQNELIKQQQALVDADSEKWREYQQTIDNNRQSIEDLTQAMENNALAMANLANDRAGNRASKLDKLNELYNARMGNRSNPNAQNSLINRILGNINRRQNAYNDAVDKNRTSVETNASNIANARNKDNAAIIAKVKQYTKAKKKIPASILQEAKKLNDNGQLYNMLVKYNASVIAYETSQETANLYNETAQQERANLAAQKMDNIQQYYQNRQNNIQQRQTRINNAISQVEAQGYIVSKKYYQKMMQQEKANNASLVKERDKLVQSLNTSVANGDIKEGSREWYELCQQIDDVTNAIDESNIALIEYQNTMRELDWSNFDRLQDKFANLRSEIDFVISEMSRKDLTDKEGGLTDNGKAVVALRGANYKMLISQAKDYEKKLAAINKQIAEDPYDQNLIDRQNELRSNYQSLITASQDELDAVKDLYQQGYDALLDRLSEVISEYEKLLDAEKDAYDYQQRIEDATKNISNLRKQLTAYENDLSEETRMKVQNITVELQKAEKDLQNTQYDKMISLTKEMFSNLQDSMAEAVQNIIDNLNPERLIELMGNDTQVFSTITNAMEGIGYMSSDDFKNLISGESGEGGILSNIDSTISQIKIDWQTMLDYLDKIAQSTSTSTTADNTNNNSESTSTSSNTGGTNTPERTGTYVDANGNVVVGVPFDADGNPIVHQQPDKTVDANGNPVFGLPDNAKGLNSIELNTELISESLNKMMDISSSLVFKPTDYSSIINSLNRNAGRDVNIEIGDIILPDVTNGKEFAESLKNTLKNDTSVQKMFKDFTVTSLTGGNSMSIRKY